VSAFPVDGTYPQRNYQVEKRNIAEQVPVWDPELCSQCGKCYFVCPHAAIRVKVYDREFLTDAPLTFKHTDPIGKEFFKDKKHILYRLLLRIVPVASFVRRFARSKVNHSPGHKAIDMMDVIPLKETEKQKWDTFFHCRILTEQE
jgi:pyruvate-ferredoxin/flavodoxin oxidoreductase